MEPPFIGKPGGGGGPGVGGSFASTVKVNSTKKRLNKPMLIFLFIIWGLVGVKLRYSIIISQHC